MFRNLIVGAVAVLVGSVGTAVAGPKEDVQAAAKKLNEAPSYSWTQTAESAFGTNTSQGKTQKDGLMWMSFSFGDNTTDVIKQGEKGAVKTEGTWKSIAELTQGDQQGPGRFMVRFAQNAQTPAAQAEAAAGKVKELSKSGDAWAGELTEEGAKDMLSFGGRRGATGAQGPEIKNAKGTAKFWTKDGVLSKAEYKVSGTMNFQGEDREMDRTTVIEIKDVGTTKVEVPAEAKAKLQ